MCNFSKSLNPPNNEKSVSDILIRIRFTFESSFWIASGCKLTILPNIQQENRIVIISAVQCLPDEAKQTLQLISYLENKLKLACALILAQNTIIVDTLITSRKALLASNAMRSSVIKSSVRHKIR